jgi:hypothetical protein
MPLLPNIPCCSSEKSLESEIIFSYEPILSWFHDKSITLKVVDEGFRYPYTPFKYLTPIPRKTAYYRDFIVVVFSDLRNLINYDES